MSLSTNMIIANLHMYQSDEDAEKARMNHQDQVVTPHQASIPQAERNAGRRKVRIRRPML